MKSIDLVRIRCKEKLEEALKNNDLEKVNFYTGLDRFLINHRCFVKIDRIKAMNILLFLGYSLEEAQELYDDLISYENIKGDFIFKEHK